MSRQSWSMPHPCPQLTASLPSGRKSSSAGFTGSCQDHSNKSYNFHLPPMLTHSSELAYLQPKFIVPLRPTVTMCSTRVTQNIPVFILYKFQGLKVLFAVYLLPQGWATSFTAEGKRRVWQRLFRTVRWILEVLVTVEASGWTHDRYMTLQAHSTKPQVLSFSDYFQNKK